MGVHIRQLPLHASEETDARQSPTTASPQAQKDRLSRCRIKRMPFGPIVQLCLLGVEGDRGPAMGRDCLHDRLSRPIDTADRALGKRENAKGSAPWPMALPQPEAVLHNKSLELTPKALTGTVAEAGIDCGSDSYSAAQLNSMLGSHDYPWRDQGVRFDVATHCT